jgi:hypothetical protein
MKDLQGTTGLYIEGEDIPFSERLQEVYEATREAPHLNFLYIYKVEGVYYSFYVHHRSGLYMCEASYHKSMNENWGERTTEERELYSIRFKKELERGNRNLTIRLLRWVCKSRDKWVLPINIDVFSPLEIYFPGFLKLAGLEAIEQRRLYAVLTRYRVVERSAMDLIYESLE